MEIYLVIERDYESSEVIRAFEDEVEADDYANTLNMGQGEAHYRLAYVVEPVDLVRR